LLDKTVVKCCSQPTNKIIDDNIKNLLNINRNRAVALQIERLTCLKAVAMSLHGAPPKMGQYYKYFYCSGMRVSSKLAKCYLDDYRENSEII
tara:strand:- start:443 stop:718 length:276 start_codon:yes stop_codon:yes gene_type:complete